MHNVCFKFWFLAHDHIVSLSKIIPQNRHYELQELEIIACFDTSQYLLLHLRKGWVLDLPPLLGRNADDKVDESLVVEPAGRRDFLYFL